MTDCMGCGCSASIYFADVAATAMRLRWLVLVHFVRLWLIRHECRGCCELVVSSACFLWLSCFMWHSCIM